MKCTTRFLGLQWDHHTWRRRVWSTETISSTVADMWGRPVTERHVVCHTEQVCDRCGAVRDTGACICDTEKGAVCAIRLARLDASRRQS